MEGVWVLEVHSPQVFATGTVTDMPSLAKACTWEMNVTQAKGA
jgi:hypothetical protein